jgi:hypothetical protein
MSLQSPISPIERLLAFLADKIPNSFCLQVRPVRLTVEQANLRVKLEKIEKEEQEPASEEAKSGIAAWFIQCCSRGRAPPQHSNTVRELSEEL